MEAWYCWDEHRDVPIGRAAEMFCMWLASDDESFDDLFEFILSSDKGVDYHAVFGYPSYVYGSDYEEFATAWVAEDERDSFLLFCQDHDEQYVFPCECDFEFDLRQADDYNERIEIFPPRSCGSKIHDDIARDRLATWIDNTEYAFYRNIERPLALGVRDLGHVQSHDDPDGWERMGTYEFVNEYFGSTRSLTSL